MTKNERLREASECKRGLRQEVDRLRQEHQDKMREAAEERRKLKQEIEALRNHGRTSPDVQKVRVDLFSHLFKNDRCRTTVFC